jgi:hypothetical protein
LGGVLAIAGGLLAGWFQVRHALQIRMAELTAERKVLMNGEALGRMKGLEGHYQASKPQDTLEWVYEQEEWFFSNLLFFPPKFSEYWLSIRRDLRTIARRETTGMGDPDDSEKIDARISESIAKAIDAIYQDANVQPLDVSIIKPAHL